MPPGTGAERDHVRPAHIRGASEPVVTHGSVSPALDGDCRSCGHVRLVLAFAHGVLRLVSCRLGLEQHYREAVPSYCGNLAEYQYAGSKNLLRQLLNIFATHLVTIRKRSASPDCCGSAMTSPTGYPARGSFREIRRVVVADNCQVTRPPEIRRGPCGRFCCPHNDPRRCHYDVHPKIMPGFG
jgi:hypothetical protein